ncbi:hypothetical protein CLV33_1203 [Jejuia pallidilutea]|uniref:Uncharacterized protein n=2 Tax=Jejuia pallidilutea TaxID=504487 RepID=A0A362WWJ0_9FLAO|nr:hypothetical protein CLV33_1203 [Jejuia pallidilutea]
MNTIILLFFNLFLITGCNNKTEKKNLEKETVASSKIEIRQEKIIDTIENKDMLNVKAIDTIKPNKIVRTINEYKTNIDNFSKKKADSELITIKDVESVTPTSEEEFDFYYSLTYPDINKQDLYNSITSAILDNAVEDKGIMFFLYLDMAQFIDGEYAEGYHVYVETVVFNNKKKFCAIYKHLSKDSKWILEALYKEVCKGIKRQEGDY